MAKENATRTLQISSNLFDTWTITHLRIFQLFGVHNFVAIQ